MSVVCEKYFQQMASFILNTQIENDTFCWRQRKQPIALGPKNNWRAQNNQYFNCFHEYKEYEGSIGLSLWVFDRTWISRGLYFIVSEWFLNFFVFVQDVEVQVHAKLGRQKERGDRDVITR